MNKWTSMPSKDKSPKTNFVQKEMFQNNLYIICILIEQCVYLKILTCETMLYILYTRIHAYSYKTK